MRDQFYLVLPSNSSMKYYPENTVTRYITQLPKPLKMPGEWVVALTEIQFPRTFLHVDDSNESIRAPRSVTAYTTDNLIPPKSKRKPQLITVSSENTSGENKRVLPHDYYYYGLIKPYKIHDVSIPSRLYTSVKALIDTLNETEIFKNHIRFEYNESIGGLVSIRRIPKNCIVGECDRPHLIHLNDKLSRALGFVPGTPLDIHTQSRFIANYPASLSLTLPDKLFVYTDICENYITGDVQTPLLRIVPVDNTNYIYGSIQTRSFSPPIYIPLLRTEFNTIEIDIRTDTGKPVPFQSGTLTATLHFKRVR